MIEDATKCTPQEQRNHALGVINRHLFDARLFAFQFHSLAVAAGWWKDPNTGEKLVVEDQVAKKLLLIYTEISEAVEGFRTNSNDSHLPTRSSIEVELADAVIRIFDLAGALGLDIIGAMHDKAIYNAVRKDHTPEERSKKNGKRF